METIYADRTISITDFKTSPAKKVKAAGGRPIAVLVNNRPEFYAVPSALFEQIADILDDVMIGDTVRERMERGKFVKVELEDL
jgi:antitoxin StbD